MVRFSENTSRISSSNHLQAYDNDAYLFTKKSSLFGRNVVVIKALTPALLKKHESVDKTQLVLLKTELGKISIRGHKETVESLQRMKNYDISIIDAQGRKRKVAAGNIHFDLLREKETDYLEKALQRYFQEVNQIKQKEEENRKEAEKLQRERPNLKTSTLKEKSSKITLERSLSFPVKELLKRILKMEKEIEEIRAQKRDAEKHSKEKDDLAIERNQKMEEHSDFIREEATKRREKLN